MQYSIGAHGSNPGEEQVKIISAFDTLLLFLDRMEHAIASDLTTLEVIEMPIGYYIGILARKKEPILRYVRKTGYRRVAALLARFTAWRNAR
jgi:hypothetical protein